MEAILERLDARNKELARLIEKAEKENDPIRYEYKKEFYANKLEMIEIIDAELNGNNHITTTLKEEIQTYHAQPPRPKYSTDLQSIDNYFNGGLELSQLVLIGGEKGAGKTAFTLQYILGVAKGFKSCFFSFEMPKWKIAARLEKSNPDVKQVENFYMIDKGRDISEIERNVKRLAKEGVQFFAIDSLMKIGNKSITTSKYEKIGDITNRLSRLAVEEDVLIILIVQVAKDDLKHNQMTVKGSGDADYDADIMFFINKDKNDNVRRYLVCTKNRQNGNEFKQELYFNPKTVQFQEHKPAFYESSYVTTVEDDKVEMVVPV